MIKFGSAERPPEVDRIDRIAWIEREIQGELRSKGIIRCGCLLPLYKIGARDRAHRLFIPNHPYEWSQYVALFRYELMLRMTAEAEEILTNHILPNNEDASKIEPIILDFACHLVRNNSHAKAARYANLLSSPNLDVYYNVLCQVLEKTNRYSEALEILDMNTTPSFVRASVKRCFESFKGEKNQFLFLIRATSILSRFMPEDNYVRIILPLYSKDEERADEKIRAYETAIIFCLTNLMEGEEDELERYNYSMVIAHALAHEVELGKNIDWIFTLLRERRSQNSPEGNEYSVGVFFNNHVISNITDPHARRIILSTIIRKYQEIGNQNKAFLYTEWLMNLGQSYRDLYLNR